MGKKVYAIIPAAGCGRRIGADKNKTMLEIAGQPILSWTLAAFESCPLIHKIILVAGEEDVAAYQKIVQACGYKKVSEIVLGGATRAESVKNGFQYAQDAAYVLIHDAARALITPNIIQNIIEKVFEMDAVITAVPVTDTIKKVSNGKILETIDREMLWCAQTPQAFSVSALRTAMSVVTTNITDEASALEKTGIPVTILEGSYENIKITTPTDLIIAEAILKKRFGEIK